MDSERIGSDNIRSVFTALPFFGMMMMVRLPAMFVICILAVPLLPALGSEPPSTPVPTVGVTAASHLVGSGGHSYLDVRTEEEFKKGHVENSLNEKNTKFIEQVALHYDKEDNIIVGCLSGVRSELASADLIAAGFKNVKNMEGGYMAWVENGLAVNKPLVQEEL
uniref:Rhodanese domain-containing protein n=1 Tax=Oryza nivara TaxID=4536 RepID=A0A0E0GY52_ORYNI